MIVVYLVCRYVWGRQ